MLSLTDLYRKDFSLAQIDMFVRAGALIPVVKSGKRMYRINEDVFKNMN